MDFSLTDDHLVLRDAVRRYCDDACPPTARGRAPAAGLPRGLADLGLMGLAIDPGLGGSGLGAVESMIVAQELGRAGIHAGWLSNAVTAGPLLAQAGTPAQCSAWLPAVAAGTLSLALSAPAPSPRVPAARRDGAHWVIDGQAAQVLDAPAAGLLLVTAATPAGPTLFALDAETPGLGRRPVALLDGRPAALLVFDAVRVGADRVLGTVGDAAPWVDAALDRGAAALCADAAGALDALLAMTIEHLSTRRQFGKPLAAFQVLQHRVADMAMTLEQVRSMACVAAMAVDGEDGARRRRMVSAAKAFVAPRVRRCAADAIQLHGAMGMTDECRVGRIARRLITDALLFGDAPFHLRRFASTSHTPGDTR